MILLKSASYWSVGIVVKYAAHTGTTAGTPHGGWYAWVDFLDDGFCDDDPDTGQVSTQGRLSTRYGVQDGQTVTGLTAAVDALLADAARLGITFQDPHLYYDGDGANADFPAPDGWRDLLNAEAQRVGWEPYYTRPASDHSGCEESRPTP